MRSDKSSSTAPKRGSAKAAPAQQSDRGGSSTAVGHSTRGTAGTSGDVAHHQPLSTADQNTGGANGQCTGGEYCSTRDGSASRNGNGGGKATGKPCAGCVGKADNKNPKGQLPDAGTDGNRGYECDDNNGIGKTNPAHTGCVSSPADECDAAVEDCDGSVPPCDAAVEDCDGSVPPCDAAVEDCDGSVPPCDAAVEDCDGSVPPCDAAVEDCDGSVPPCDAAVEDCDGSVPPCDAAVEDCDGPEIAGEDDQMNPGDNRPSVVLGTEAFAAAPQSGVAPAAGAPQSEVQPAAGVLPNTGAGSLMGMLAGAGIALLLTGVLTLVLQRKLNRV
ncbi:hypothetical protein [Nocardioides mesophilus]|uniref:Gram-positive cocci surface proteins LPxTG domain-containing protein n=1 Tax=Nocardioides mesophilus TaxID=433659 RepID=A0A7G9REB1_9ACTN|nr:hypothetical protein [Nocardioides mesophilus]QNN53936.1 hypothetical protein H9L09_06005 [Nocardioides mesophilus]